MSDPFVSNALGSAAAGIVSRVFTHPLDTAKARLQAVYTPSQAIKNGTANLQRSRNFYRGTVDVLLQTARIEGIRGLYRGLGAVVVGGTPGTMIYLCSYDAVKESLQSTHGSGDNFLVHFASGMIAETLACIIYVPVDVVKERMQVQHSDPGGKHVAGNYRNSWDALKRIKKTEGLSGVYRGYAATLASFGPFSAFYFVFYEKFKYMTRMRLSRPEDNSSRANLEKVEIPFAWTILCSAGAGAIASWITSPLDMAKLRLQVQRGTLAGNSSEATATNYRGVIDCLRHSYREGGTLALFRGATARVLHFVPATTITMTAYETFRSYLAKTVT